MSLREAKFIRQVHQVGLDRVRKILSQDLELALYDCFRSSIWWEDRDILESDLTAREAAKLLGVSDVMVSNVRRAFGLLSKAQVAHRWKATCMDPVTADPEHKSGRRIEALQLAKAAGRPGGRRPALTDEKAEIARQMRGQQTPEGVPMYTVTEIAQHLDVGRSTLYRYLDASPVDGPS